MFKKLQQYNAARVPGSISVTASLTAVALATLITPQIVLRAFSIGKANAALFASLLIGMAAFLLTCFAVNSVTSIAPRRNTHQLAARYLGAWAGILVGAARILLHGLLVLLGVELVVTAVNSVIRLEPWDKVLAVALVLVLILPTLAAGIGHGLRWPRWTAFVGILGLVILLAWALIQEFLGAINFDEITLARQDAFASKPVSNAGSTLLESVLAGCFPAAIVYTISERVMAIPQRRRVGLKRILFVSVPMLILIIVTMYFAVAFELPGRRMGLPALSIAYALMGEYGRIAMSVLFALTGLSAATAAYRQMSRVLRELAIDGLLPRRLAAEDSVVPRRIMVGIVSVLLAVIAWFLDSARSLAMIYIVVAVFMGCILCLAIIARSRSILNDSTDADDRLFARKSRWIFRGFGILLFSSIVAMAWVEPWWVATAALSLAVPAIFLMVHRKGLGKLHQILENESGGMGRIVPTRVHSFVLVNQLDLPTLKALDWARANRGSIVQGLCVDVDPARTRKLRKDWNAQQLPVALTVVGTPAGAERGPVIEYVRAFRRIHPNDVVMVYYSRVISTGLWERFFVRHTTPSIISELELEPGVMVVQVPYRIDKAN